MTHSLLSPAPTWRRIAACWFIALTVTAIQPSICRPASVADAPDSTQESRTVDLAADLHRTARPVFPGRPHVALALAGGGARGLAHIGVLRALEENHIGVDLICGTSMGAIIGGLYAAGIGPDSLETIVRAINWRDLLANTPSRASLLLSQKEKTDDWFVSLPLHGLRPQWPNGATSGQRLYNFLSSLTEDATYRSGSDFDSLPVRFRAVATDLVTGERVVLADGELASAMRASTAFPLAIAPLREGNRLLADGGLVDPLPVQLADSLSDGPVVAINTTSGLAAAGQLRDPYMLANQATSVMTAPRLSAALAEADFVCVPALGTVTNVDFGAVDTIIAIGYEAGQVLARQILANTHQDHDPAIQGTERDGQATDRHVLAQIQFHGNTAITDSALQSALEQKVDQPYDRGDLMASLRRLERLYARRHYTLAAITGANWDTTNGNLSIAIDEAPLAGVDLSGNRSVKSWVILRNFPLKTGSPYNARQVAQGLADLHATGLFDQITAEVTRTDKGPRLHLNVTEKTADALRLGLHHNLEYQSEGFIQWAKINLFGLGNELTAHAQYAPRRELYFVRAKSDRIFRSYLAAAVRVYHYRHERRLYADHQQSGSFQTTREGFELSFAQNISRIAQMAFIASSEDVNLEKDSVLTKPHHSVMALQARIDNLDDADFPTRGRRLSAKLSWGDKFFGGDLVYRDFAADGEWVTSPLDKLSLSFALRFASADRRLPLQERFSLGGRRSFMGLADDELLGDHLIAATIKGRYRIYPRSYAEARGDLGTIWADGAPVRVNRDWRLGIGAGLVFDTPFGPLEILQGLADSGDSRFYFSWGYEF